MNMTNKNRQEIVVRENSPYQPKVGEPSMTLKKVRSEIKKEIDKAKEDFLKKAKTDNLLEIQKQIQTDKVSLITVFGVFASITSFLTIEFQFLKTICSLEKLIGFTLILASLLMCFNIVLDYLVKLRTDEETPKPNGYFIFLLILLLALGFVFTSLNREEKCQENKAYQKYLEDFDKRQEEFNKSFREDQNKELEKLQKKIKNIESQISK